MLLLHFVLAAAHSNAEHAEAAVRRVPMTAEREPSRERHMVREIRAHGVSVLERGYRWASSLLTLWTAPVPEEPIDGLVDGLVSPKEGPDGPKDPPSSMGGMPVWGWVVLAVGLVAVLAVLAWLLAEQEPAAHVVAATLPLTALDLLLHREFQVVKTRGTVQLESRDGKEEVALAPFAGTRCVYAQTLVEVWSGTGWDTACELVEARSFLLADGDTHVVVEVTPQAPAALDLPPSATFQGDLVQLPAAVQKRLQQLPGRKLPAYSMFKVREWAVNAGDELVACGLVVRRVGKKETRIALAPGGLGDSNADAMATLFSPIRAARWHAVGNRVILAAPAE